jgi:hypothetical protein
MGGCPPLGLARDRPTNYENSYSYTVTLTVNEVMDKAQDDV